MKTNALVITAAATLVAIVGLETLLVALGQDANALLKLVIGTVPVLVTLFVALNTNRKVEQVQKQTNGTLSAKDKLVNELLAALPPSQAQAILSAQTPPTAPTTQDSTAPIPPTPTGENAPVLEGPQDLPNRAP